MPDKALLDFIVSQKAIGAHIEKIRSDLITNSWTNEDIDRAIAYLDIQKKKFDHRHLLFKKITWSFVVTVVILGCIYIVFLLYGKNTSVIFEKKSDLVKFPDLTPPPVKEIIEPVASSSDIVEDIQAVRKRFTEQFPDALYIRAQREEDVMIVSGSTADELNVQTTREYVFTKTDSVWSVDLDKTVEREIKIQTQASSTIPMYARPKVQTIKLKPSPPIVNSKDTEILVEIKNIGVVSTEKLVFTVGYDTRDVFEVQVPVAVGSEQVYVWRYKPYPLGKVYNDKKGKHTITISIPNEEPFVKEFDLY